MTTITEALSSALQHHQAGRLAEAGAIYRQVLAADAGHPDALHLLGLIHARSGDRSRAVALMRRSLAATPAFAECLYNLGNTLRDAGRADEAIPLLRRYARLRPGDAGCRHSLAHTLYNALGLKAIPEAIGYLEQALALRPDFAEALADLGSLLRLGGDTEASIPRQWQALSVQPGFAASYVGLGNALMELGRAKEAVVTFRRAQTLSPGSPEVLYNLGSALYLAGTLEDSLSAYQAAAATGYVKARLRVAAVLIDLGRLREAEVELTEALRIADGSGDFDIGEALELYASVLAQQGRHAEARRFFQEFPSREAGRYARFRGDCMTLIGESLLREGQLADACDLLGRVEGDRSRFFTVKSIAFLRHSLQVLGLPEPVRRPSDPGRPRMGSSTLATHGRFAHNVLEYVLLRLYADQFGLVLETPEWVGQYVFDLDDPLQADPLRATVFARRTLNDQLKGVPGPVLAGCDIRSPLWLYEHAEAYRERVWSWLRIRSAWLPMLDMVMEPLRARGRTVVALHLRRGDFVNANYPISETGWYVDWLRSVWSGLDNPVLYVASDDLAAVKQDFAEFAPVCLHDLVRPWRGLEFLQDFYVLMNADVLGVSTKSGFSFLAALLNRQARLFVEPEGKTGRIRPFSPWTPADIPS